MPTLRANRTGSASRARSRLLGREGSGVPCEPSPQVARAPGAIRKVGATAEFEIRGEEEVVGFEVTSELLRR